MPTRLRRRLPRGDGGETLLEVLVALVILGVAAVAIVGAMTVSVKVSDIHRKQSTAAADVRDYAEAIEKTVAAGNYKSCAGTSDYAVYTPDGGYQASIVSVQYGTTGDTTTPPAWTSTCSSSTDNGVQQLTLQVASSDNRATEQLTIVIRKPYALQVQ